MLDFVNQMFSGFTDTIKGIANGLKLAFENIIYVDPSASEKVLSDFSKFGFIMIGVALATGITYTIVRKIRG